MNLETEIDRELWLAVRRSYEAQAWSNAILDAIHFIGDAVRQKAGLESDGTALAGQAFGGKQPKLRLNRLQTDSEKNVQAGVEQLFRGLYQGVRNPRSHEKVDDSQRDADSVIIFVDYLLRTVGHARNPFSVEVAVSRVLDRNFVANERYARLVIEGIPERKRLQVALAVYRRRAETKCQNLRPFFQAVTAAMSAEDVIDLFQAISEELSTTTEESALRGTLQILDDSNWLRVGELARLRAENWLVENAREGRYDPTTGRCLGGSLATWSRDFWPCFTLKREMSAALVFMLRSDSRERQDYVLQYFFPSLDALSAEPSYTLQELLVQRLIKGDQRFKDALDGAFLWEDDRWNDDVKAARQKFEATGATPGEEFDDDIPF